MGAGASACGAARQPAGSAEASIWWDFENLPPPAGTSAAQAAAALRHAALDAAGERATISAFAAFVDTKHTPDRQLAALTAQGVDVIHSVANARKRAEASDRALSTAMLLWLYDRGDAASVAVLASGDHDFGPLLAKLRDKGRVRVVLAARLHGPGAVAPSYAAAATEALDWAELTSGKVAADARAADSRTAVAERGVPPSSAAAAARGVPVTVEPEAAAAPVPSHTPIAAPVASVTDGPSAAVDGGGRLSAAELANVRALLRAAGPAGVLRSELRRAYEQRYGVALTAPAKTARGERKGPSLTQQLTAKTAGVAVLTDAASQATARFVAPEHAPQQVGAPPAPR